MKLAALALDYDGTIAKSDRLEPAVRDAIGDARARGVVVLLVTGRILRELEQVAGDLHFVDGVVAENGAVLYFPDSGHTSTLAPVIPDSFAARLRARRLDVTVGQCLVDGAAADAPAVLEIIRQMELPLVLLFNRGRVMTMAQGVSKATGLHAALDALRLSPRNTVAVGDAENDHAMLQFAEVGAAVEWGSAALKATADLTIKGAGPKAVADFVRQLAKDGRLPLPPRARRRLRLGYTENGEEFSLAVRGRNILIAGDAKSGKSWVAGLLAEQLILYGYSMCVIDPEGDYRSLEALPGVTLLGGEEPPPTPRDLLKALRYPDRSVVIDLSRLSHDEKIAHSRAMLIALHTTRRRTGLPHRILVDEAHYFLHDAAAQHLLDLDANGYIVVTYCASRLPQELLDATEVMLVTCESSPVEIDELYKRCATCPQVAGASARWSSLTHLPVGQAIALPVTAEAGGELRLFTIGRRLTTHVRHKQKYVDVPVSENLAFQIASDGGQPRRLRTLRQFVEALEQASPAELDGYLRRGDFSKWVADVFGDYALAEELREQERDYRGSRGRDTIAQIISAVRSRYDLTADAAA